MSKRRLVAERAAVGHGMLGFGVLVPIRGNAARKRSAQGIPTARETGRGTDIIRDWIERGTTKSGFFLGMHDSLKSKRRKMRNIWKRRKSQLGKEQRLTSQGDLGNCIACAKIRAASYPPPPPPPGGWGGVYVARAVDPG